MSRSVFLLITLFFVSAFAQNTGAQEALFTVRGMLIDKQTKEPLFGASVSFESENGKIVGVTADAQGMFTLEKIPAGKYKVSASFIGYNQLVISKVEVANENNSFITLELESSLTKLNEVVVSETKRGGDNAPINSMAVISARSFNAEESEMVAASLGDPGRLALSYAGVRGQSDILNGIVVRGNAPKGVMWRVEGVEVPSPNHFSQEGYGAGAICMMSGQVIGTSDFYTGAFPSEYGNAMSAVFDVKLKKGDTQKRHYFLQAGMMGFEGGTEGPFTKNKKASYLINYRYSTLAVFEKMGMDIGNTITAYQDLTFKLNLPTTKAGTFTVFGVGGQSKLTVSEQNRRNTKTKEKVKTYDMALTGLSNAYSLNEKNVLKTTLLFAANRERLDKDEVSRGTGASVPSYRLGGSNMYFRTVVQVDSRLSSRSSLRSGIITSNMRFNIDDLYDAARNTGEYKAVGLTYTLQAFSQWKYLLTEKLTLHTGMHFIYFGLNGNFNIEPRAALAWQINKKQSVAVAAGLHSKLEALANYMVHEPWTGSTPNADVDFTKAAQTGVSYEIIPVKHLKLKTELYFQYLYSVPISTDEGSSFSILNSQDRYTTNVLVNKGRGMNYGIELTLEKTFAKNYYILANGSLFESKYYAADGIWRNSRYNTNFITSLTAGKDFIFGKTNNWTFGLNGRVLWSGGERTEPSAFEDQVTNYFRVDTRMSIARQRENVKWIFAIDVQNASNRKNESTLDEIQSTGILPVLSFRIDL